MLEVASEGGGGEWRVESGELTSLLHPVPRTPPRTQTTRTHIETDRQMTHSFGSPCDTSTPFENFPHGVLIYGIMCGIGRNPGQKRRKGGTAKTQRQARARDGTWRGSERKRKARNERGTRGKTRAARNQSGLKSERPGIRTARSRGGT